MFEMIKVDKIPEKSRRTESAEIIKLFDDFIQSGEAVMLVKTDRKYSTNYSLGNVLRDATKRYGYRSVKVTTRGEGTYLIRKDL